MISPQHSASAVSTAPRETIARASAVVVILALGGLFYGYNQLAHLRKSHEASTQKTHRELARLESENAVLQAREATLRSTAASPVAPSNDPPQAATAAEDRTQRMSALHAWARMMAAGNGLRRQLVFLGRPVPPFAVPPDYQLTTQFGELYAIDQDAVSRLQDLLTSTRAQIEDLTAANTTLQKQSDGTYRLQVKALSEIQIAAYRERIVSTFSEVLGEEGYRAFSVLNGESGAESGRAGGPKDFFLSFGTIDRTVTISKIDRGRYRYEMQFSPNGRASGSVSTLEELRQKIGGGGKLLPADF